MLRWGFCVTHAQRQTITQEGEYTVVIDSDLSDGSLTYERDGNGHETRYASDCAGRLTSTIDAIGHAESRSYYLDGKLEDYAYPEEKIKEAMKDLPKV